MRITRRAQMGSAEYMTLFLPCTWDEFLMKMAAAYTEAMSHRKLLVLDLDETLIHAAEQRLDRDGDFLLFGYHVYKRPHLGIFLEFAFNAFDVGVWTSSGEQYARGIASELFRDRQPVFLLSSSKCTTRRDFDTGEYVPVKRLSKLKSKGYRLEHIIAVDDTPEKHRENYGNLVQVTEYTGDQGDEELLLLRDYLAILASETNVRGVEKRGWRSRTVAARRAGDPPAPPAEAE